MGKKDPRVDAYIAKSAAFARPILTHLRRLVHKACPDVEETIKWNFPNFEYHGLMCNMAAFMAHCSFGFLKGTQLDDPQGYLQKVGRTAMGQFGRITSLKDLPPDRAIVAFVKQAAKLNAEPAKSPKPRKAKPKPALKPPKDLLNALGKNKKAGAAFDAFSPSCKREYIEWIVEAKRPETRERRIATAVVWMADGKTRNWKYTKKIGRPVKKAFDAIWY
ncbi:MAG: YdeI/OmpD-associated family protein [Deltaproteobacteria bacterium]|nr:YdeI/OmpD-associated family protein [Deltaproteobacteria bacterium]